MATDNDDEFSGFFGDDSGGFFDEPQEPSSAPESQEEAPPEEPDAPRSSCWNCGKSQAILPSLRK